MRDVSICLKEFEKFYHFLMKDAPEGYVPWFFPLEKNGKDPCSDAILDINPNSKGSWHHDSARLTKEQCIEHIKQGFNIGISARRGDALIIGDIDNLDYFNQLPKETLIDISRKRVGWHFFGWDKDGSAKLNIPTGNGEMRSNNEYVVACGSYVPFDLEHKKDKKAFDELPAEAINDPLLGYYSVKEAVPLRPLTFDDLPEFFKDKFSKNVEADNKIRFKEENKSFKEFVGEGKYSELLKLTISDIIEVLPDKRRVGHPLHDSTTDANFSFSKDGKLCHCWRDLVSLNAIQFLCVKAKYVSCGDAGTPHKVEGRKEIGREFSKIKGDKKALEVAYQEALKLGLIKEWKFKEKKPKGEKEPTEEKEFLIWVDKFNSYIVDIEAVADYFDKQYHFLTVEGKTKDTLYLYNGKTWEQGAKSFIKSECEKILGKYAKINPVSEIVAKLERRNHISQEEFDLVDVNILPLENGIWDINKKELLEHNPKYYFKTIIPINHNPKAECKKWEKFLEEALYPEDIKVLQEWFGFNLYRLYLIKKALILLGGTDTGKTVTLETLIAFIGDLNKTGLSLQKISSGNDFAKLSLKDKYSNVYDDLSSKDLSDGGNFKIATGGGTISAEEKFGDYKQFKNFAKHTFGTNKIPPVVDSDDMAYYSRWIILRLDNPPEKKDLFLKQKLAGEKEGVLLWALEGLYRLLENGEFSYNKSPEEVKIIMEMSGDPLIQFGSDCLIKSDKRISKEQMYELYTFWANEQKKPLLSKEQLGRRLNQKVTYIVPKNDTKERFWDNVSINNLWVGKLQSNKKSNKDTKLDTFDSSKNNTSKCPEVYSPLDMYVLKPSKPSQEQKELNDTSDTNSKEDIDFSNLDQEDSDE
jgi:putative DNA primase/helicase